MDLRTFTKKFHQIKARGFVRSERRGNTGVGHTLESLLGLAENNIAVSDMEVAELKAHRMGSQSMITLFTLDRGAWMVNQLEAIHRYGTVDDDGRPNLYMTLFSGKGSSDLSLSVDASAANVIHRSGTVLGKWRHVDLAFRFEQKFPALMLVSAESEMRGSDEWFHYTSAKLLSGTNSKKLESGLTRGWIAMDLRLHDNDGVVRNHGTAFRIQESYLADLFEDIIEI